MGKNTESEALRVSFCPQPEQTPQMEIGLGKLSRAAKAGAIPGGSIEDGVLHLSKLSSKVPVGADDLLFDLYKRMPEARITDIMPERVNDFETVAFGI